jgi:hypothetical protein
MTQVGGQSNHGHKLCDIYNEFLAFVPQSIGTRSAGRDGTYADRKSALTTETACIQSLACGTTPRIFAGLFFEHVRKLDFMRTIQRCSPAARSPLRSMRLTNIFVQVRP